MSAPPPAVKPAVPIKQISAPDDRFRCAPYGAVLFARACTERQRMLALPRDQRSGDYSFCDGCEDGPRVLVQLGLAAPTPDGSRPKNSLMRGNKRKRRRLPQKRDDQIAPSDAGREAAAAALAAPRPLAPPGKRRIVVLPRAAQEETTAPLAEEVPPPPAPAREGDPLLAEMHVLEDGLRRIEVETRRLLARVKSARARLAARP